MSNADLNIDTNFGMGFTLQTILQENHDLAKLGILLSDNKEKKDDDPWASLDAQAAFLGPNLWGAPQDQDLKLEYSDLEEFLNENEAAARQRQPAPQVAGPPAPAAPASLSALQLTPPQPTQPPPPPAAAQQARRPSQLPPPPPPPPRPPPQQPPQPPQPQQTQPPPQQPPQQQQRRQPCDLREPKPGAETPPEAYRNDRERAGVDTGVRVKVEFQVSPTDLALATVPGMEFDPQTHQFSDEELKPQPMCKKSKKQVVPEERKDQKYWTRRQRNNTAAKRSRDARRLKENQIVLRANFLEKENAALREAMEELTKKNQELRTRIESCRCH